MVRQILVLAATTMLMSACGGSTNTPTEKPSTPYQGCSTPDADSGKDTPEKPDKPDKKETPPDLSAWKKISHTSPSGWEKLGKSAAKEIESQLAPKLNGAVFLAGSGSAEAPHSTSGSDEEWSEWLDSLNMGTLYLVKGEKDALNVLKTNGEKLMAKLDGATPEGNAEFATVKSGRVLVHAKSTKYGTYVLVGIATADDAAGKLEAWAKSIKE
ncbi:MAG: hypothetical protein V3V10_00985 [Planctomycetota bacterium]